MSSLARFKEKRTRLKNELELIDQQLKNVLRDRWLKNSTDVLELQINRLTYLDALRFLRPADKQDIKERQKIFDTFPEWVKKNIPEKERLVFHATTLANTKRILDSGKIVSGKDRWTIHTSGDDAGEFSVSTKDFIDISMEHHMDLIESYKEYEWYVPAGCLFALKVNEKEYNFAESECHVHNISLRQNPENLYGIITTPENQDRVKWWLQKNDFPANKVCTFDSFKEKIAEDKIFFDLIKSYQKTK